MYAGQRVAVIIPALDEAEAIGSVLDSIDRSIVDRVVVGDNGSTDATPAVAHAHGAVVVREERRGYGSACLAAVAAASEAEILVFLDADGSDDPTEIPLLLAALGKGADLVIGSRVTGRAEPGSLTPLQRFGNALTCTLVRILWGIRYTDLGPFRAIRRPAYDALTMSDPDFGWTIEMQVKAAQQGLRIAEVPVSYRPRRAGKSKVSGTLRGSYGAGKRILGYVAAAKLGELQGPRRSQPRRDTARPAPLDTRRPALVGIPRLALGALLALLTLLALFVSLRLPLWLLPGPGRDEAAYHYWAHHPEPAFAPLLQLAVRVFELPFGPSLLALRAPVILLGLLLPLLHDLHLRRNRAPGSTRFFHAALLMVTPWQCFAGSILHPDAFLTAALLGLVLAARDGRVLLTAMFAALAAWSKPTGLLVLPIAAWLLGKLDSDRPRRVFAARALVAAAALPFLTAVDPRLLDGIGQFGRVADDVSPARRVTTWLVGLLFLAGPVLPLLAGVGIRERLRALRQGAPPLRREAHAVLSVSILLIAVFCGAALFRGQFKGNWLLPAFVLLLPTHGQASPTVPVRLHRVLLGAGLSLTLLASILQATVLSNPRLAGELEARFAWAAHTVGSYSVQAGAREAEVSAASTWAERFAEYGDAREFARDVEFAWRRASAPGADEARKRGLDSDGETGERIGMEKAPGAAPPASGPGFSDTGALRCLISDDYGLAMQLHWYLGHDRIRVALPADGVFYRTSNTAIAEIAETAAAAPQPMLILAVRGGPEAVLRDEAGHLALPDLIQIGERIGNVAHPITGQAIELWSAHLRPTNEP